MPGIFSQYDSQDLNRIAAKGILEKLRNIRLITGNIQKNINPL